MMNFAARPLQTESLHASSFVAGSLPNGNQSITVTQIPKIRSRIPFAAKVVARLTDVNPKDTSAVLKLRQSNAISYYKRGEENFYRQCDFYPGYLDKGYVHFPTKPSYFERHPLDGVTKDPLAPLLGAIKANTKNASAENEPAERIFQQLSLAVSNENSRFHDWAAVKTIVNSAEQSYLLAALREAPAKQLDTFLKKAVMHAIDEKPEFLDTVKRLIDCIDGPLLDSMMDHTKSECFNHAGSRVYGFMHTLATHSDQWAMDCFLHAVKPHLSSASGNSDAEGQSQCLGDKLLSAMVRYGASAGSVEFLLKNGCNPNVKDENGQTAVHGLAQSLRHNEYKAILELLISYGADLNSVDDKGQTLLMLAAKDPLDHNLYSEVWGDCRGNNNVLVQVLLHRGASTGIKDHDGKSAYWYAKHDKWSVMCCESDQWGWETKGLTGHPSARTYIKNHYTCTLPSVEKTIEEADHYDFMPHHRGEAEPPMDILKTSPKFEKWQERADYIDYVCRVLINEDGKLNNGELALGTKPISDPQSHKVDLGILPVLLESTVVHDYAAQYFDQFRASDL